MNVTKYERPEPKAPGAAGNFPSWIRKTDEERIQNIQRVYERDYSDVEFADLKLWNQYLVKPSGWVAQQEAVEETQPG